MREATAPEAIKLDLYHLVWIFTVCCVVGLIGETVVSYFVDGRWEDRAGFLWGRSAHLRRRRRFDDRDAVALVRGARRCAVRRGRLVGAGFEWFAGWFWENAFGIVAWDYSSQPFNLGGHTCLGMALVWGGAGVAWMKLALPVLQRAADVVPVSWRGVFAWGLLAFFLVDTAMTFLAFDCWMNRLAGIEPAGPVQLFFADHYGNAVMEGRFQTMSMYPVLANFR